MLTSYFIIKRSSWHIRFFTVISITILCYQWIMLIHIPRRGTWVIPCASWGRGGNTPTLTSSTTPMAYNWTPCMSPDPIYVTRKRGCSIGRNGWHIQIDGYNAAWIKMDDPTTFTRIFSRLTKKGENNWKHTIFMSFCFYTPFSLG